MNSLKQKAKTAKQIEKEMLATWKKDRCSKKASEEWVRLEDAQSFEEKCLEYAKLVAGQAQKYAEDKKDAQQEIDRLKDLLLEYNKEAVEYEQKVQEWILDLDDFLVQWLWNDKGKIPSQDLAILLEWREKFEDVEGV